MRCHKRQNGDIHNKEGPDLTQQPVPECSEPAEDHADPRIVRSGNVRTH